MKYDLSSQLLAILSDKSQKIQKEIVRWPTLGKLIYLKPDLDEDRENISKNVLNEEQLFASIRKFPQAPCNLRLDNLNIKSKILDTFKDKLENESLTPMQKELLTIMSNYHVCINFYILSDYFFFFFFC